MGRRITKKVNGVVVEKYLWQGLTRLLAVYDGSNNLIMRFTYADGRMPLSMTKGGVTYYLFYDQVGSLRGVIDTTDAFVKIVGYDSFGGIISDSNATFTVPFGFAGGLYDADTGLMRFGRRDYDPSIGKWTAKDPIDFAGEDANLTAYVWNNPVNWIDPYGLLSPGPSIDPGTIGQKSPLGEVNQNGLVVYNPYFPYDPNSEPFVIVGGGITILLHDFGVNSAEGITKGHSTAIVGISADLTCGKKGDVEIGFGGRRLGIGINFDGTGITGFSGHFGFSWPPSPAYGSVSK